MNSLTLLLTLLLLSSPLMAEELPDAPHLKMRPVIEAYSANEAMIVHNSPSTFKAEKPYRIFDWEFIAVHTLHAGALAGDLYLTSRGVSHGCEEASSNLGPHPGIGRTVGVGLAEFGGELALDIGMKALARNKGLPRWFADLGGSVGAGIGTFKHVSGARAWMRVPGCL